MGLHVYTEVERSRNRAEPIPELDKRKDSQNIPSNTAPRTKFVPKEFVIGRYITSESNNVYYLKEGNIWGAVVKDLALLDNKLFFDYSEDIVEFDVAPNNKLIVFTVRRHAYSDNLYGDYESDTVLIKNMETQDVNVLFETDLGRDASLSSVKFSDDGKKVVFTNNAVWVAEVGTYKLKKTEGLKIGSFCQLYDIQEFSPDNKLVLVRMGCYEGALQRIFNLGDMSQLAEFDNGYVGGGKFVADFIDNQDVLVVNTDEYEMRSTEFGSLFYIENIFTGDKLDIYKSAYRYHSVTGKTGNKVFIHSSGSGDKAQGEYVVFDLATRSMTLYTSSIRGLVVTSLDKKNLLKLGNLQNTDLADYILISDSVRARTNSDAPRIDVN
jgi:hypothetical protein